MLSVGDNARQFLRRLLPQRWTMDLLAAPLLPPHVFLHPPAILFFSFFFLFVRDVNPFSPSFRDVFLALRLAASLFPTLSSGEDSSIRAQPLAYNETENLRGTQRMRRMITYIETKNRPARRSAALSLFLSRSFSSLFRLLKTLRYFYLTKRTVAAWTTIKYCFKKICSQKLVTENTIKFLILIIKFFFITFLFVIKIYDSIYNRYILQLYL